VNQDGRSDLAITTRCSLTSCPESVGALFGNSGRTFAEAISAADPSYFDLLAVADFNGDLKNDLVDSYGELNTMGAYLALATSSSSWKKQVEIPLSDAGWTSELLFAGDFNGDRKPDIVVYQAQTGLLQELVNTTLSGKYGLCSYPTTGQGIHVCSPVSGSSAKSPVRFRTAANSFQPIRKTELWVDGNKITEQYRSWLDYSTPVASGSHKVDIYVNNYDDDHQHTTFSFNVEYSTSTQLQSSLNPSVYGQGVVLTATVTSAGPMPTGPVTFKNGTTNIGTATLNSGVAKLMKSTLPAGADSITALYNGDAASAKSTSAVLSQVVNKATTTTGIKSSLNPSTHGQAVTFSATVTSPTAKVTGSVTFTAGSTMLATVTLSGGKASVTTAALARGSSVVTATFNGGTNFVASSASLTQVVK
jgi:hypothetical protein